MAVQWKPNRRPINAVISQFVVEAQQQIETNLFTQRIWPNEVYPGYTAVNAHRKSLGEWYSTGEGAQSFEGNVVHADQAGNITVTFSFLDYMRFVDMGVGSGTRLGEVDSQRKARYQNRYVSSWDRRVGKSQRPAIMMEMRHIQSRITNYVQDTLGYQGMAYIVDNIDGIELKL